MTRVSDVRRFLWLLRNYSAPYWWAVGLLLLTSYVGTALSALFPVLMAPILDLALGVPVGAGVSGTAPNDGLSLTNLGAAFFDWVGVRAVDDRFRAIVVLCLVYLAVGILKGIADFGNYLLGLWIRVRATAALQRDLFRHLLGLSMSFFNRQRTGELVSRLEADANRGTAQGLQIEVQDNGAGFTPEAAQKAASPFFTTRNVGLGLGLTVSRKIMETHQGKLEIVAPKLGQAGVVRISLPLEGPAKGT